MIVVPEFFAKDLKVIDQTYRVEKPEDGQGFYIIKDVDLTLKADGGKSLTIPDPKILRVRGPLVVLWVPDLDQRALDQLRQMKFKALELGIFDNPVNELAYYQKLKKDAKQKNKEAAVEIISEGIMELHKLATRKTWDYGGSKS